ncbi:MAG TPA: galactokinase family protein [Gemmatimonadales bacterium]|jgi:galactokinase|nr:galactokinase family protein [Gemmatimonadales bacterium]
MSGPEAERKEPLFAGAARALGADPPTRAYFVPGRVEFLGKHTDYAGGRSLVCAVERGLCLVAHARADARLRVAAPGAGAPGTGAPGTGAAGAGATAELALRPDLPVPWGDWSAYVATVARRLARDFPGLGTGVDLAFDGDLPPAAGLSSSSALVVGVFLALAEANRLTEREDFRAALPSPEAIGDYLGAVENGRPFGPWPGDHGVGTLGGSQDQTTILCARPGALLQMSWVPARFERTAPLPAGYGLVIGVSGVVAEKAGGARDAYNAASRATVELLAVWRAATGRDDPTLAAALAGPPHARTRLAALVDHEAPHLRARLDQFVTESDELIPAAGDALLRGDLTALGELVDRSQAGAERGLGNQIPETIHLQRSARRLGAAAASAFGAGFGGSVWALVESAKAEPFRHAWGEEYRAAFPPRAEAARFFTTRPGPAALRL